MYRVELKVSSHAQPEQHNRRFLMYRVELKALSPWLKPPTTPCVPNVPCGVESRTDLPWLTVAAGFLMYRVELKVELMQNQKSNSESKVPNVPCGVESKKPEKILIPIF